MAEDTPPPSDLPELPEKAVSLPKTDGPGAASAQDEESGDEHSGGAVPIPPGPEHRSEKGGADYFGFGGDDSAEIFASELLNNDVRLESEAVARVAGLLRGDHSVVCVIGRDSAISIGRSALFDWKGAAKQLDIRQVTDTGFIATGQISLLIRDLEIPRGNPSPLYVAEFESTSREGVGLLRALIKGGEHERLAAEFRSRNATLLIMIDHQTNARVDNLYRFTLGQPPSWLHEVCWWREILLRWRGISGSEARVFDGFEARLTDEMPKLTEWKLLKAMQAVEEKLKDDLAGEALARELEGVLKDARHSEGGNSHAVEAAESRYLPILRAHDGDASLLQTALAISALCGDGLEYRKFSALGEAILYGAQIETTEWRAVEKTRTNEAGAADWNVTETQSRHSDVQDAPDVWIRRLDRIAEEVGLKIVNTDGARIVRFQDPGIAGEIYDLLSSRFPSIVLTMAERLYRGRFLFSRSRLVREGATAFLTAAIRFDRAASRQRLGEVLGWAEAFLRVPPGGQSELAPGELIETDALRAGEHSICVSLFFADVWRIDFDELRQEIRHLLKSGEGSVDEIGFRIRVGLDIEHDWGIGVGEGLAEMADSPKTPVDPDLVYEVVMDWSVRNGMPVRELLPVVEALLAGKRQSHALGLRLLRTLLREGTMRRDRYDPAVDSGAARALLASSDEFRRRWLVGLLQFDWSSADTPETDLNTNQLLGYLVWLFLKTGREPIAVDRVYVAMGSVLLQAARQFGPPLRTGDSDAVFENWILFRAGAEDATDDEKELLRVYLTKTDDGKPPYRVRRWLHLRHNMIFWALSLFGSLFFLDCCFACTGIDPSRPFRDGADIEDDNREVKQVLDRLVASMAAAPAGSLRKIAQQWSYIEWIWARIAQELSRLEDPDLTPGDRKQLAIMLQNKARKIGLMRQGLSKRIAKSAEAK